MQNFQSLLTDHQEDGTKETDFPRITVFGRQAENCEKYLKKGRMVAVEGRIQTGSYTNKDGNKVYTTDVVANRVEFIDWGDRHPSGGQSPQGGQQSEPNRGSDNSIPQGFEAINDDDIPF